MPKVTVSYETYKMFAKLYKIPLSKGGKRKPIKQLQVEIREYETKHKPENGLYVTFRKLPL